MAGTQSDPDDIITEINVVPLVDITLVVLIIFMLTADLIAQQSIKVDLPKAATGEAPEPTTIALTMTRAGAIYLNGKPTNAADLRARLPKLVKADPRVQAIVAADKDVTHGQVIWLIDLIRQLGVYRFALNIDPTDHPQEPSAPVARPTAASP